MNNDERIATETPAGKVRMPFGKHKDLMLEQVPVDYLQWAIGTIPEGKHPQLLSDMHAVLHERGQDLRGGNLLVTLHAVDRFSQRAVDVWQAQGNGRGIVSCLERLAVDAQHVYIARHPVPENEERINVDVEGVRLCFSVTNGIWTLRTVKGGK